MRKNRIIMARFLGVLHPQEACIRRSARGAERVRVAKESVTRRTPDVGAGTRREGTRDRRRRAAERNVQRRPGEHRHKRAAGLALMPAVAQRALARGVFIRRAYGGCSAAWASFCIGVALSCDAAIRSGKREAGSGRATVGFHGPQSSRQPRGKNLTKIGFSSLPPRMNCLRADG